MLLLPSLRVCLAGRFNLFFVKIWICFCLNFFLCFRVVLMCWYKK
jgi:hypothetical protein